MLAESSVSDGSCFVCLVLLIHSNFFCSFENFLIGIDTLYSSPVAGLTVAGAILAPPPVPFFFCSYCRYGLPICAASAPPSEEEEEEEEEDWRDGEEEEEDGG